MSRFGQVVNTHKNKATVSTSRRGICAGCSERSSCSFDNALGKDKPEEVTVINPVKATPGDMVEFDLLGHTELRISLIVWIAPLGGLIAGSVVGTNLYSQLSLSQDIATLIGAGLGFVAAFIPVMIYDRIAAKGVKLLPRIKKIVNKASCPVDPEPE